MHVEQRTAESSITLNVNMLRLVLKRVRCGQYSASAGRVGDIFHVIFTLSHYHKHVQRTMMYASCVYITHVIGILHHVCTECTEHRLRIRQNETMKNFATALCDLHHRYCQLVKKRLWRGGEGRGGWTTRDPELKCTEL